MGMKTRFRWRAMAVWCSVAIRRGCRSGGVSRAGEREEGEVSKGSGGGAAWFRAWRREVRKAARGWQIRRVVGWVCCVSI